MYEFAWTVRGFHRDHSPEQIVQICQAAYDEFTRRHRLRLVWSRWPTDLENAWPADPDTPLDFDLDPDGDVSTPLLVLVPADS